MCRSKAMFYLLFIGLLTTANCFAEDQATSGVANDNQLDSGSRIGIDKDGPFVLTSQGAKLRGKWITPAGKSSKYVESLRNRLTHENVLLCKHAALALGELGDEARLAIPDLRQLLVHPDDQVSIAAAQSLELILNSKSRENPPAPITTQPAP
jgi:hypothetical protein